MSEILKNIETCRGEDVLAEVSGLPQDPHFGSLVNEAFDPMQQQALHQAGWDGYSEVIAQHKPYTFASAIIQMKSNLLLLLRALWQFPFGSGTLRSLADDASLRSMSDDASLRSLSDDASLRSLADMWQHYITRLSGNETYGIPSRLSSLTDLPSAPLLVSDRKISGVPEAIDGMSYVRILCGDNSMIEELKDDNYGWTMARPFQMFSACKKVTMNCTGHYNGLWIVANAPVEELHVKLTSIYGARAVYQNNSLKKLYAEDLEYYGAWDYTNIFEDCQNLEEIYFSGMKGRYNNCLSGLVNNMPKLTHLEFGDFQQYDYNGYGTFIGSCPKLIDLRFKSLSVSLNISGWVPDETVLDGGDNEALFLSNFRTYIALRLTANGSGKTLTLSQAVYDAIKDESHLFVFDEGTMTIYAYLTNIKHWTVTK